MSHSWSDWRVYSLEMTFTLEQTIFLTALTLARGQTHKLHNQLSKYIYLSVFSNFVRMVPGIVISSQLLIDMHVLARMRDVYVLQLAVGGRLSAPAPHSHPAHIMTYM